MGNTQCSVEDGAHLATIARGFCPFPDYSPHPYFINTFSRNSSFHLKNHYAAVQSSLTPQQLEDFTHNLRTTFGKHGRVTHGGVGVVALSLALLFDTIARRVKGEWESESEPIPGLFIKDLRGSYPPQVYTISKYLRLVPHIANNPTRMTEETERFLEKLVKEIQPLGEDFNKLTKVEDTTVNNRGIIFIFARGLNFHLMRIKNGTEKVQFNQSVLQPTFEYVFNLNCDVKTVSEEFVAAMPNFDNHTQETFQRCGYRGYEGDPVIYVIAKNHWLDILFKPVLNGFISDTAQSEDFDLKANALGKWK